jgi:hypothetical protein
VKVVLGRDEHHAPIGKDVRLSKNVWNPDFAEIGAADVAQCDVEIGDGSRPHAAPCLDSLEARTIDDPLLPTLLAGIRPSAAIRRAVATETSRRVAASSMVRASSLMSDYAHEHSPRSVLPMLTAYPRAVESGSYSWSKCQNGNTQRAWLLDGCPRQESNLDLPLRRRSSYPLDYEGAWTRLSAKATGAAGRPTGDHFAASSPGAARSAQRRRRASARRAGSWRPRLLRPPLG